MVTWSEAFTIFTLILTSYFPHRWKDLTSYIIASHPMHVPPVQWSCSNGWHNYDQAFCQHAAATKLLDWSTMNIQLYNFHAAGASVHSGSGVSLSELPEPSGADSFQVIGRLWNRGRCSAQFASCQFTHRCSTCAGAHRALECSCCFDKHLSMIANADLLLLPPYLRPPWKPGVILDVPCCFPDCFFFFRLVDLLWLPLVFLPDSWPLVITLLLKLCYVIFVDSS